MKNTYYLFALLFVTSFITSCGSEKESLAFLQKELVAVSIDGNHICCQNAQPPTLFFDTTEMSVFGSTGCNKYFAPYQLSDSLLQFGMVGVTRMLCDSVQNELEIKVLNVLNATTSYDVTPDELILKQGKTVLAVLKEKKQPEDRCCKPSSDKKCQDNMPVILPDTSESVSPCQHHQGCTHTCSKSCQSSIE